MRAALGLTTNRAGRLAMLAGATALASVFGAAMPATALAQQIEAVAPGVSGDSELLLEADTLVVDNDGNTITVVGGVQIDYDGNRLVAQRVIYYRDTSRLVASGGVEIVDPQGTRVQADEVDITDDFRDGFVRALRVETADRTYFAADSAERRDGEVTTFNYGVYTACEPCEDRPERPPIWRIKAQKIIWDGRSKTVRFERSRFEFFGMPLAFLPAFEVADPTVKRKSGFLFPSFGGSDQTGFGVRVPYYFALSPTYDLTVYGSGFAKQGFLGEAEWRQRFNNGEYSVRIGGIYQLNPDAFAANRVDRTRFRGMVGTTGRFEINPRWTFGWDVLAQTDKNFSHRYGIEGYAAPVFRSQLYLTGLNDRNYFDLRAYRFHVQEELRDGIGSARNDRQPWVLPSFDYAVKSDDPVMGGELSITLNAQGIHRERFDGLGFEGQNFDNRAVVRGIEGTTGRVTAEAEWKRTVITPGGVTLTPLLHARGDAIGANYRGQSVARINDVASYINAQPDLGGANADIRSAYYRAMVTAGLEARWPVLFSTASSTHILEPVGQLFIRPDAPYGGSLGIPNEDAQSLVFDAASLFERDKFSGYDRIEGGTRANLGIRYSGSFGNGWSANGIFGQSFHLAGQNPYASPDLVHVGAYSGLESARSDYVGQVGVTTPNGISLIAGGRFDEKTFAMQRTDLTASYASRPLSLVARYSYIAAQPHYGFPSDREEVRLSASTRFAENWRVFGSGTYDLQSKVLVSRSIGFAYDDECFAYSLTVGETEDTRTRRVQRNIGFTISLRTIGDIGTSTSAFAN